MFAVGMCARVCVCVYESNWYVRVCDVRVSVCVSVSKSPSCAYNQIIFFFWSAPQSTATSHASTVTIISKALEEYLPERLGRGGWVCLASDGFVSNIDFLKNL